jgi:hypothetical protein
MLSVKLYVSKQYRLLSELIICFVDKFALSISSGQQACILYIQLFAFSDKQLGQDLHNLLTTTVVKKIMKQKSNNIQRASLGCNSYRYNQVKTIWPCILK